QDPSAVIRRAAIEAVQITRDTNAATRLRELFIIANARRMAAGGAFGVPASAGKAAPAPTGVRFQNVPPAKAGAPSLPNDAEECRSILLSLAAIQDSASIDLIVPL